MAQIHYIYQIIETMRYNLGDYFMIFDEIENNSALLNLIIS